MTKKKEILLGSLAVLALALIYVLYRFNYLPHPKYTNEKFGIETYSSQVDRDGDGVDDQTDILQSVWAYLATRPKYKSKYYATGYPDDGYGVCTDVVAFGLLGAGYDLMELVHEDVLAHGDRYDIDPVDENIDFRRVRNLKVFFRYNATALTTDIYDIDQWQGGDIVIFELILDVVIDFLVDDDGLFRCADHAIVKRLGQRDVVDRLFDIGGRFNVGWNVARADAQGRLAAAVRRLDHRVAAGSQDRCDARMIHQRRGCFHARMFDPLNAVFRRARFDRRFIDDLGGRNGALLGIWVETEDDRVSRLQTDQTLENRGGRRIGDRGDAGDDADWFGDIG